MNMFVSVLTCIYKDDYTLVYMRVCLRNLQKKKRPDYTNTVRLDIYRPAIRFL